MSNAMAFPISLSRLSPDEIAWLAAKSSQTGKPVDEIAKDAIRAALKRDGFKYPHPQEEVPK